MPADQDAAQRKPRLAWFSPLELEESRPAEGARSLSAYCSKILLPLLSQTFNIELFHNSFRPYKDFVTHHYLSAFSRHRSAPFDFFFYQLEDHPASNFIRQCCGIMPGVTWFHDFLFTSHGPEPILNSPWQEVVKKFHDPSRSWSPRGVEFPERERTGVREATLSFLSLFSTEIGLSHWRSYSGDSLGKDLSVSSYFLPVPLPREEISLPAGEPRLVYCGSPRIEHRAHKMLAALASMKQSLPLLWLIDSQDKGRAEELLREFGVSRVELVCGKTPEKWLTSLRESDIAVHTQFSVYGQPGPYLGISLLAGLPSLVTEFAFSDFLSSEHVFKIRPGETESSEMRMILERIVAGDVYFPRSDVIRVAQESLSARLIADELSFALLSRERNYASLQARWKSLEEQARDDVQGFFQFQAKTTDARELFGSDRYFNSALAVGRELGWLA